MDNDIQCKERILIRTHEGQCAICDTIQLDASQRRLLHLVNGYTPLGHLAKRLDAKSDWSAIARQLLDKGLVAVVGE